MSNPEYAQLAEARIAQQGRIITALRKAIAPFADIALSRDADETAADMIDGPDLDITPEQVRAARVAYEQT